MAFDRLELIVGGCAVVVLLWLGVRLGAALRSNAERRAGRQHNLRGQAGERRAEQILRSLGYRVCARHVARSYALEVDGISEEIQLFADMIVERDGQRLVAEVKTGKQAPRVGHADTRRQMLEYQLAFEVPGVLLVDAESGRVREVRFPLSGESSTSMARPWLVGQGVKLIGVIALCLGVFWVFCRG